MMILALEFSSSLRSVAIVDSSTGKSLASISERLGALTGVALINQAMHQAALKPNAIESIALGVGPGSYAGIRSSIAIAQGWQLAHSIPVIPVSSVECLAETARRSGLRGNWTIIIDAQRGEFYCARYALSETSITEMEPLRISPAPSDVSLLGPDAAKHQPNATTLYPSAETLAFLAATSGPVPASEIEPIYLREATFVKASPPRFM
jgi:tRNA threonylcarbamoyl adenosine modification protein YeaZ